MRSAEFYYGKPGIVTEDGVQLDIGDDAIPFVGTDLISVADGAGGRSFTKQRDVNPLLLKAETSFDAATVGCLDGDVADYRRQYDNNFQYLYTLGDRYATLGPRKSSYFGARLTNIFMQYWLRKLLQGQSSEQLFRHLQSFNQEQLEEELGKIEHYLAVNLKHSLDKASSNCKMSMRSSGPNVSLMGTTYSGILFYEGENEVYTLTIQAGDSLAIALVTEKNKDNQPMLSFRSLLPPQEREDDGGMDNCIDVNHDFYLRCAYHVIPKPCMLMVTSDGCFDAFPSMLQFERFVMDKLCDEKSNDLASAVDLIYQYFATGISTDDSSTFAMCGFGLDAYENVSRLAYRRLKEMDKEYGDIIQATGTPRNEEEQDEIMQQITLEENELLRNYTEVFWEKTEWIRKYCEKRMADSIPGEIEKINDEIRTAAKKADDQIRQHERDILKLIEANWILLREKIDPSISLLDISGRQRAKSGLLGISFGKKISPIDVIQQISAQLDDTKKKICIDAERIERTSQKYVSLCQMVASESKADADIKNEVSDNIDQIVQLHRQMMRALDEKDTLEEHLCQATDQLLRDERQQIQSYFQQILAHNELAIVTIPTQNQEQIRSMLKRIDTLKSELNSLDANKDGRIAGAAKRVYSERPITYIRMCLQESPENADDELIQQIRKELEKIHENYRSKLERQTKKEVLLKQYRHDYESIMISRR